MRLKITTFLLAVLLFLCLQAISQEKPDKPLGRHSRINNYASASERQTNIPVSSRPGIKTVSRDSGYRARFAKLYQDKEFTVKSHVWKYMDIFSQAKRDNTHFVKCFFKYYAPVFEEAIEKNKLPGELIYLPVALSAINQDGFTKKEDGGPWGLSYLVARKYGLNINELMDEREDLLLSTKVAMAYLKNLFDKYQDWPLAITAFCSSPAVITRAIKRAGGAKDFWSVYEHLPGKTRDIFPAFIAMVFTRNYKEKNLVLDRESIRMDDCSPTIMDKPLSIQTGTANPNPVFLNYRKPGAPDRITGNKNPLDNAKPFHKKKIKQKADSRVVKPAQAKARVYHIIKKGDTLTNISRGYNVDISQIKNWNNINGSLIRIGDKITIYVPKEKVKYYQASTVPRLLNKNM